MSLSNFATSVSLSRDGNNIIIGDPYSSEYSAFDPGYAYVWEYHIMTNEWIQKGNTINGTWNYGNTGLTVGINEDGSIVAVGSPADSGTGQVTMYKYNNSVSDWVQMGNIIKGIDYQYHNVGLSLSLSEAGHMIAIGSPALYNFTFNGRTQIFEYDDYDNEWKLVETHSMEQIMSMP